MLFIARWFIFFLCFFSKQKTAYELRMSDWSSDVCSSDLIVERLDEQMFEIERREPRDVAAGLRPDELQFVAAQLNQLAPRFRADADPVDAARDRKRAVAFDRDGEAAVVQRPHQRVIHLQHRFTRSEEHTLELQSLMRISYAVLCLK